MLKFPLEGEVAKYDAHGQKYKNGYIIPYAGKENNGQDRAYKTSEKLPKRIRLLNGPDDDCTE